MLTEIIRAKKEFGEEAAKTLKASIKKFLIFNRPIKAGE